MKTSIKSSWQQRKFFKSSPQLVGSNREVRLAKLSWIKPDLPSEEAAGLQRNYQTSWKTNTFLHLTNSHKTKSNRRRILLNSRKITQVMFMGYKSPFIKPFLNKTKKFTKENKRYRRMSCLIYSKKEKNKRGDTIPTCWTIKGSFSFCFFLIQNTSKGYTYLKQSSGAGMQSWEPFSKSKAGFCYFFFFSFFAGTYRDWNK